MQPGRGKERSREASRRRRLWRFEMGRRNSCFLQGGRLQEAGKQLRPELQSCCDRPPSRPCGRVGWGEAGACGCSSRAGHLIGWAGSPTRLGAPTPDSRGLSLARQEPRLPAPSPRPLFFQTFFRPLSCIQQFSKIQPKRGGLSGCAYSEPCRGGPGAGRGRLGAPAPPHWDSGGSWRSPGQEPTSEGPLSAAPAPGGPGRAAGFWAWGPRCLKASSVFAWAPKPRQ